MSSDNCCLCASDEGILLDIFAGGGKAHCEKIETCLSVKIEKRNAVSKKICHKCAYELDACSKFVQKYRDTRDVREGKSKRSKVHCALCLEPGVKGYIFELSEGPPLNNSLRKIRETFDDSFFKDQPKKLSICLSCRYNLDVLFDLKSVYQSTLDKLNDDKGKEASAYPRTKTSVVSRKTTYIPLPVLNGDKAYESDSSMSSAMPVRRKRGRPRKDSASSVAFRNCEQCDTAVECGIDMYRYHRTGRTVCKDCWLKMDPEKVTNSKRRKLGLVLKDVLVNPSKYTSVYKVERDAKGNTTYLITDDSSENEEKEPPVKRGRRAGQPLVKLTTDETISVDKKKSARRAASGKSSNREDETPEETIVQEIKKPSKRVVSGKWAKRDEEPPTKIAVKARPKTVAERNDAFTSDSETMVLRTRSNSIASLVKKARASSLSDFETAMPIAKKIGRPRKIQTLKPVTPPKIVETRTQRLTRRAASAVETTVEKSVRKSVDKSVGKSVDKQIEKSIDKPSEKSVDESSDKIDRPVKRSRANSLTSQDSASSSRPTSSPRNAKSLSETVSSTPKTVRSKAKSMSPTTSVSETELETPFACGVCKIEYSNKLIGMAHELTHSKQPEVKLQRVAIPEVIIEEAPTETSMVEKPEQQSNDVSSTSDHSPVNAESDETPIAKAPSETETKPDTKLEDDEKSDQCDETSIAEEETNVSVAETKDTKTVDDNSVEINETCENDEETNVTEIREPETNDEDRKIEERGANEEIDNDNDETEETNDDNVTEKSQEEDKPASEQRVENEDAEKADSEQKSVEEEKEEDQENDEKKAEEKDKEEVEEEDKEKVEEKDTEKVEEIDMEKVEEKHIENIEEKDEENIDEKDKENIEEKYEENIEEKDEENIEEKDEENIEENVEENDEEASLKDPTEDPVKANGVDADHEADSKIDRAKSVEAAESNGRIVDARAPEDVHPESRETLENENKNESENAKSVKHEKIVSVEEAENKSLESTLESAPVDVEAVDDDVVVRKQSESIGVVTDVLREVFDLATAEVQKRLETERPNDEKCSAPVAETVENISREIQNSADMPSLEPLVEDRSGNERS